MMKQLAKKKEFCSFLNDIHISNKYYEHTLKIWDEYDIKNLGEYHHL